MDLLSDDNQDSFRRFIQESVDQGCLWGLEGDDGWALCASEKYPNTEVMPFWSQPELAEIHCKEDWLNHAVVPVSLEEFLEDWLPGMHEDVYLVGINWNEQLEGDEWEPLDLLQEFDDILSED